MKKIIALLFVSTFIFTACEGPEGPPGEPGTVIVGETFEYANVSFTPQNEFLFTATYNPPLVNGDAILVYRLEGVVSGNDVWEPLPTVFFNNDTGDDLRFRFNYTLNRVRILAESSDYSAFGPDLLSNQVFRAVIVPADLINGVDTSNINEVMKAANIKTVQKMY
ncbi:hypothetical protein [Galbibacter mesophilus]|uniref:hypothetical protein n=1 Tax=Galbibacter mesophilus TaxID=379069 RepID=UPI00191F1DD4|nr:hypothetical protein [Galbibacter mesophilus]MCM5662921.1 hypothetical protein [Galbibacter mesophilus]